MDLSIVTTMYCSEKYLQEFYKRVSSEAQKITHNYEFIFVNDGSPDDSLKKVLALQESDPRISVIDLSRNFGHHKAMMTGLAHSKGANVFLIDCDLEEPPELLGVFYPKLMESKVDVVYGVQGKRKGAFWERFSGEIFYWLFNKLSDHPVPRNLVTVRLMTRRYLNSLILHRDQQVFIPGLWAITGFDQLAVTIRKGHKGATSYTLTKKISVFVNALTSFSSKPLVLIFYLGMLISSVSTVAGLYLVACKLLVHEYLAGWASLVVSVWFLGGITISSLGVIGIYLARVFVETKDRPYTIIRQVHAKLPNQLTEFTKR